MITLWGHGNCGLIPRLHSYDDAKKHYEQVVPIRGRKQLVKPLGKNRRFTWYRIVEQTVANQSENSEYKYYACQLFDRDTVSFYPNGDIHINTSGWRDVNTGAFINCVLNGLGNMVSESGKWFFQNSKGQLFKFEKDMVIRKNEEGIYMPTVMIADKVHRVNRKAINAIRKKYKGIVDYGKTMLSLDPKLTKMERMELTKNGITANRFVPYNHWESQDSALSRARWFELADKQSESGDLELLYDLAQYVATAAGHYSYRDDRYSCQPDWYENYIDEMIKYQFADEVFTTEELPIGQASADRNKKYFYIRSIH